MIVRKTLDPKIIFRVAWKRITILLFISTSVCLAYHLYGNKDLAIDSLPASILGVAIAFLIGFRVNSAYERWWEARKIWGAIVNDSRSFTRQALTLLSVKHHKNGNSEELKQYQKQVIYRQIAFAYAMKNSLRKMDVMEEIRPFVSEQEFNELKTQKNIPNAIIQKQGKVLQEIQEHGYIEDFRHMQMDLKLSSLCDSMGACERIKNTVFPRQYSFYSTFFVRLYTYLLPFVLVADSGWFTIPSTLIIGFIFYALDGIANGIENPFENTLNDVPMSSICRTIEINLRQQLGEKELPAAIEAANGFLY